MTWLLVALGGALGSSARFGLGLLLLGAAPLGTLAVNTLGCGLMGYLQARLGTEPLRLLFMTGFCGGFTTWSAFSLETLTLAQEGRLGAAALYTGGTVVLAFAALGLGWYLGR